MSMAYTSETRITPNRSMFYRVEGLQNKTMNGPIAIAGFNQAVNRANFLANGFIPAGTIIARTDADHTYPSMWVPALLDTGDAGAQANEVAGTVTMLWDPVYLTRNDAGVINETTVTGTFLIPGSEAYVLRSKIPNIQVGDSLSTGATFRAITEAELDLIPGLINVEKFGITGIAGL